MSKSLSASLLAFLALSFITPASHAADAAAPQGMKEWSFLVFLNGHNNLDRYGAININQMEKVGSTKDVNILVQWASAADPSTKRLYVTKDDDTHLVTSPVVQEMSRVDMGDWRQIVEFVKWAHANYPAKRYFINVWDHGSGWHMMQARADGGGAFFPSDISWDDETGNSISTKELGQAMAESAAVIGHKVDLYGSDACLMAMAEVAAEMSDSVDVFAGSEEVEPAAGWPYEAVLARWAAAPQSSAADVARILTQEYIKSYQGGSNGRMEVTFSAFDLSQMDAFNRSIRDLGNTLQGLGTEERKAVVEAASNAQSFTYSDYVDLIDFLNRVEKGRLLDSESTRGVRDAASRFVIINMTTERYADAKGVAMWIPSYKGTFNSYLQKYKALKFDAATQWSDVLGKLLQ